MYSLAVLAMPPIGYASVQTSHSYHPSINAQANICEAYELLLIDKSDGVIMRVACDPDLG